MTFPCSSACASTAGAWLRETPTSAPWPEDLASEALLRALARPAPDGNEAAWGEGILRHVLADHVRRNARAARALATLLVSPLPSSAAETPEEALLMRERRHLLWQALLALSPAQAELLRLRFWEELDDATVARAGAIAPGTVRTRIHRTLVRLRAALGHLRGLAPVWFGPQPAALALMPLALGGALALAEVPPAAPEATARVAVPVASGRVATPAPPPVSAPVRRSPAPRSLPAPAPAPPARLAPTPAPTAPAVLRMSFADDEVTADLQRPDDLLLVGPPARVRSSSLLEIPSSFTAALIKMMEDL